MTHEKFDLPPKSVKYRTRTYPRLPVVAVLGDTVLSETGEVSTVNDLLDAIPKMPATLFAVVGAADFIAWLNKTYLLRDPQHWQWRASEDERAIYNPNNPRKTYRVSTVIHYFGFRRGPSERVFHRIIDPVTMYASKLSEIWEGDDPIINLLKWGVAIRDFCDDNDIQVRPTIGSTAVQFLTDRRFYPENRRKVPAKINERAREHLPGNHYHLNVYPSPRQNYNAYYLDQHRSHHYHAGLTHFPCANDLYAYGHFRSLSRTYHTETNPKFNGLYCLDLVAPPEKPRYSWLGDDLKCQFVFTNELPHILDMGYRVTGVRAAWGSTIREKQGLNAYARWACEQLDKYDDAKWLKPILLATYGTLACRPKYQESVFRLSKSGDPTILFTGKHRLNGRRAKSKIKLEPGIANVIHRGMIEAATRSESIGFAQLLEYMGYRVLSIYADGVIVRADDDKPLPEVLPEPWEVKQTLNHLRFVNQQAFISDGMTKLPGIGRERNEYRQHTPGHAPRRKMYDALTGRQIMTDRRI